MLYSECSFFVSPFCVHVANPARGKKLPNEARGPKSASFLVILLHPVVMGLVLSFHILLIVRMREAKSPKRSSYVKNVIFP
jgi:hypothetical protein